MSLVYNQPRFSRRLLEKHKKSPPSFSIDYYDDHWLLNKAPTKFLYTQPLSSILDDINSLRIPVDFIELFDAANVSYYEGCMIVENTDHRKPRAHHQQSSNKEPESVRVVLHPSPETLYADICLLNAKHGNTWTDMQALEIEADILNSIIPTLHLNPDPNYTRIVNSVIHATTLPETVLRKRKRSHEPGEDESDKAKRAKLWTQYMHPRHGKPSISQKRSLFDILGEIATKDQKGAYSLKYKPVRPPKKDPAAVIRPTLSADASAQAVAPLAPGPAPVGTASVVSSLPVPVQTGREEMTEDEAKLTTIKHVTEVPVMLNGKPKPVIAQPMVAASPHIPSPVDQHKASVLPPVIRTSAVVPVLANSPTPVPPHPQHIPPQLPAASPRPNPPTDLSQAPKKSTQSIPTVIPLNKPRGHPSHSPAQAAQSRPQLLPTAIPPIPPNMPAQWQEYFAAQNHATLQHTLSQQQPAHPQTQAKPQLQLPTSSLRSPPQISSRMQPQPQHSVSAQALPPSESQPQQRAQSKQSPSPSQAQIQTKQQLPLQTQNNQPTPQPPQIAVHAAQAPSQGFVGIPPTMYKPSGVAPQYANTPAQRSSSLAHPSQEHIAAAHQPMQRTAAGTQMQPHTPTHPNQWSLQQQQAAAARFLQSQQAATAAHHPQVLQQHGHAIGQQHPAQQANMPQGHGPSQQAMMHAQMQYNQMYPYQMHPNMLRMPPNAIAQSANAQAQYMAWRAAQGAGRDAGAQYSMAMRAQQQQQQQQ